VAPAEPPEQDRLPSHSLEDWHRLWGADRPFPIRSHRGGLLGRLVVALKRLLRPLVKAPQADLWDRQRVFNLILIERILAQRHEQRLGDLENFVPRALDDLLRHNDALFSRVDQRLDRYRREASELLTALGDALAVARRAEGPPAPAEPDAAPLLRMHEERAYFELERRFRGTEDEIRRRIERYAPYLEGAGERGGVLDLGCGRGESLAMLAEAGVPARGVDASAAMVARCRERGLAAEEGELFETLAGLEPASLGGIVSFHVIEHLPPESLDRLVRLAHRALAPGGVLLLETPNPLSVVVAARSFWLDPTHRRPVHPESLELTVRLAGFDPVERLELRPFPEEERLPELDLASLPEAQRDLADRINRLRDRLDDLLYGCRDYAIVAGKPDGRSAG
jgi:O-antigen chain-terminating methyltransferase